MRSSNISCACACCVLPIKDGDDLSRYQVWINEAQVIMDGRKKVPTTLHSTNTCCPGIDRETNTHLLSSNLTWKNLCICRAAVKTKMQATYINIFFVAKNALYLNGLITENHRSIANSVTVKMEALLRRNTKKRFPNRWQKIYPAQLTGIGFLIIWNSGVRKIATPAKAKKRFITSLIISFE